MQHKSTDIMESNNNKIINGFSKLSKEGKMEWIVKEYLDNDATAIDFLKSYWHEDAKVQKLQSLTQMKALTKR